MKPLLAFIALIVPAMSLANDESDMVMPEIVRKASHTVEVLMRHTPTTGECFPDRSARVRLVNEVVMLSDLALYPHMVADLSEDLVAFQNGQLWGACDKTGKVVIAPQFESHFAFSAGLAGVVLKGKYGFINKDAKLVIEPKFDMDFTWDFVGNVCPVRLDGKNAVIDRKGQFVWPPGLLVSENLGGGVRIQTTDGKKGFLDDDGNLIPNEQPNRNYFKGE